MKTKSSLKNKVLNWEKTGKYYVEWVAKTPLRDYFFKNVNFENFSVWWITNICGKDNVVNNNWYYQLRDILFENEHIVFNKFKFYLIFFIKLIKNFITSLFWCFVIKLIFFTRFNKISRRYCFNSYHFNFVKKKNLVFDRLFGVAPIKKNKNQNYYLIHIQSQKEFISSIFNFKKKAKKLGIPFFISNEYIKISDIIKIYYFSIISVIKVLNYIKLKKNFFYINQKDCSNVLIPMLISSFSGNIQASLIYAKALYNFFSINNTKTFINYGEFNPGFRSVYYFLRKNKFPPKIVSIQHSYANKNLLFYFNKKEEFSKQLDNEGKYFSPSPDYYLIQGEHFKKLLKKYFIKKTKIIGPLKYDLTNFNLNKKIYKKNKSKIESSKFQKTILICPTIGDEDSIIDCLKKCNLNNIRLILSPHPVLKKARKDMIKKFNDKFEKKVNIKIFDNLSSLELIFHADLVICGFSSLAVESLICKVPSVRIINHEHPHFFDLKDGVNNIKSWKELDDLINKKTKIVVNKKIQLTINNIFYKLDNRAHLRFWNFIKKQNL